MVAHHSSDDNFQVTNIARVLGKNQDIIQNKNSEKDSAVTAEFETNSYEESIIRV